MTLFYYVEVKKLQNDTRDKKHGTTENYTA